MANKRLIDADAFGLFLLGKMGFNPASAETVLQWMEDFIKKNTVDAAEVVHGRWIVEFDDKGWKKHSCSNCDYFRRTDIHVSLNWDYCPHCGAKMDGGNEDG